MKLSFVALVRQEVMEGRMLVSRRIRYNHDFHVSMFLLQHEQSHVSIVFTLCKCANWNFFYPDVFLLWTNYLKQYEAGAASSQLMMCANNQTAASKHQDWAKADLMSVHHEPGSPWVTSFNSKITWLIINCFMSCRRTLLQ